MLDRMSLKSVRTFEMKLVSIRDHREEENKKREEQNWIIKSEKHEWYF